MINFPTSPALNDLHTEGGNTWIFNGVAWRLRDRVTSTITETDTTRAPSSAAVFEALAVKADDVDVVHTTGAETVDGQKTFQEPLLVDMNANAAAAGAAGVSVFGDGNKERVEVVSSTGDPTFQGLHYGGTVAAPTDTPNNSDLVSLAGGGWADGARANSAFLRAYSTENWTATAHGTKWSFRTTANGSTLTLERVMVDEDGLTATSGALLVTGTRTTNPFSINVAATGNGRIMPLTNTDTSTTSNFQFNMRAGATAYALFGVYASEYTATAGFQGYTVVECVQGTGIKYSARQGDHVWTTGTAYTTERMKLTAAGVLSVAGNVVLDATDYDEAATASKLVMRTANADIQCRLVRPNFSNQTTISGAIAYRINNSTDNYIRFCSDPAAVRTWLELPSGSFTPTLTAITNAGTLTAQACFYQRVGAIVAVSGTFDVTPTSPGANVVVDMNNPVASAFTSSFDAGGTGVASGTVPDRKLVEISANLTNDRLRFTFESASTAVHRVRFSGMYRII